MFIGTGKVDGAYVGSSAVSKMYIGSTKVWPLSNNWFIGANRTIDYTAPADQYAPHTYVVGSFASSDPVNTGEKWLGSTELLKPDSLSITMSKSAILGSEAVSITLLLTCPDGRPGAGQNTGFSQFRMSIAGTSGWSPTTLTLNRTDATYSSQKNTFDRWTEEWSWDATISGLSATSSTHNDSGYVTTNTGILV